MDRVGGRDDNGVLRQPPEFFEAGQVVRSVSDEKRKPCADADRCAFTRAGPGMELAEAVERELLGGIPALVVNAAEDAPCFRIVGARFGDHLRVSAGDVVKDAEGQDVAPRSRHRLRHGGDDRA
jgi:hypothetical protein